MELDLRMKQRSFLKIAGVAGAATLALVLTDRLLKPLAQGDVREEKWVLSMCIVG